MFWTSPRAEAGQRRQTTQPVAEDENNFYSRCVGIQSRSEQSHDFYCNAIGARARRLYFGQSYARTEYSKFTLNGQLNSPEVHWKRTLGGQLCFLHFCEARARGSFQCLNGLNDTESIDSYWFHWRMIERKRLRHPKCSTFFVETALQKELGGFADFSSLGGKLFMLEDVGALEYFGVLILKT